MELTDHLIKSMNEIWDKVKQQQEDILQLRWRIKTEASKKNQWRQAYYDLKGQTQQPQEGPSNKDARTRQPASGTVDNNKREYHGWPYQEWLTYFKDYFNRTQSDNQEVRTIIAQWRSDLKLTEKGVQKGSDLTNVWNFWYAKQQQAKKIIAKDKEKKKKEARTTNTTNTGQEPKPPHVFNAVAPAFTPPGQIKESMVAEHQSKGDTDDHHTAACEIGEEAAAATAEDTGHVAKESDSTNYIEPKTAEQILEEEYRHNAEDGTTWTYTTWARYASKAGFTWQEVDEAWDLYEPGKGWTEPDEEDLAL